LFSDYLPTKFHLRKLKRAFSNWQYQLKGQAWNALYIENHDHPRIVSRYGSEAFRAESAKMLAVMYLFQQGTPFVYQGQELGMTNWHPENPDMYEDVQTRYNYAHSNLKKTPEQRLQAMWRSSRDSARTLMQWDSTDNAGFTTGKPWFYVNENYKQINVAAQERDPDSVLNFYRKAIHLRKSLFCVRHGEYREHFPHSGKVYMYSMTSETEKIMVVCSFSETQLRYRTPKGFDLNTAELVLGNYAKPIKNTLHPYECKVYLWK
ncbi:MAG: alpha-amylase family glycosyl hydrolase, partial [Faecousia sp.]